MSILSIAIILFIILETLNVTMLYFTPETKRGNGVGVFNAYEKSKSDPEVHRLVKYLINWVAGTKIIFIGLLIVIIFTGDTLTQILSVIVLILTISVFYVGLYPLIKTMDMNQELSPVGYSKTLGIMISVFLVVFAISLGITLIF